eukprot:GHVU01132339.1.p1 GENE.GHVU01132339.1~~GHVU01132339.1.p1  ORF type:complete len:432 (+),score=49.21 GHVU01132339.1:269-1564(+)
MVDPPLTTVLRLRKILNDDDEDLQRRCSAACSSSTAIASLLAGTRDCTNHPSHRRPNKRRNRPAAEERLLDDYFNPDSVFDRRDFQGRFRMTPDRFASIERDLIAAGLLRQGKNGTKDQGGSVKLQMTVALRLLAYNNPYDKIEEDLRVSRSTADNYLKDYIKALVTCYQGVYLNQLTPERLEAAERHYAARGFPGCCGSIDCFHEYWDNCPTAWRAAFKGRGSRPSIVLEAVVDHERRILHHYFGCAGSCNDINVFDSSPIIDAFVAPDSPFNRQFTVAGQRFDSNYLLGDGIYPSVPFLMTPYKAPSTRAENHLNRHLSSNRQDVECGFGILRKQWCVLRNPCRFAHEETIEYAVKACIIMHNMGRDDSALHPDNYSNRYSLPSRPSNALPPRVSPLQHIGGAAEEEHKRLKAALTQHNWDRTGSSTSN